ncbi:DUF4365 domain-containing protein [Microcoleus sp. F8-D3]
MELNQRKELFSKAYVRAVTAVVGCSVDQPENDYDSVDLCIKAVDRDPMQPHRLELQLKCTSRDVLDAQCVRYPLNVKNYNDLRVTAFIPRLQVVVLVPENIGEWIQQSEQEMLLRHCAYWVSLRGMPETRNTNRITVELPRRNHFTPQALESIMQRISKGGFP